MERLNLTPLLIGIMLFSATNLMSNLPALFPLLFLFLPLLSPLWVLSPMKIRYIIWISNHIDEFVPRYSSSGNVPFIWIVEKRIPSFIHPVRKEIHSFHHCDWKDGCACFFITNKDSADTDLFLSTWIYSAILLYPWTRKIRKGIMRLEDRYQYLVR